MNERSNINGCCRQCIMQMRSYKFLFWIPLDCILHFHYIVISETFEHLKSYKNPFSDQSLNRFNNDLVCSKHFFHNNKNEVFIAYWEIFENWLRKILNSATNLHCCNIVQIKTKIPCVQVWHLSNDVLYDKLMFKCCEGHHKERKLVTHLTTGNKNKRKYSQRQPHCIHLHRVSVDSGLELVAVKG